MGVRACLPWLGPGRDPPPARLRGPTYQPTNLATGRQGPVAGTVGWQRGGVRTGAESVGGWVVAGSRTVLCHTALYRTVPYCTNVGGGSLSPAVLVPRPALLHLRRGVCMLEEGADGFVCDGWIDGWMVALVQ